MTFLRWPTALGAAVFALSGCGSSGTSSGPTDSGGASNDAPTANDATSASSDAGAGDTSTSTAPSDAAGSDAIAADTASGDAAGDKTFTASPPACFDFATATVSADCSAGQLRLLTGANVDLNARNTAATLCDLGGGFTSLAAVPSSYASCTWTTYIEGAAGLANEGMIVRSEDLSHHWKVHIVSNTLPNLVFSFAVID